MPVDELLSLLGLCLRAGKLVCGDDMVSQAVSAGEVRLAVLSADAGAAIRRRAERYPVPVVTARGGSGALGRALGRRPTAVCGVTEPGLAAAAAKKAAAQDARYEPAARLLAEKNERIQSRRGAKKPRKKPAGRRKTGGANPSTHTKRGGERA